MVLTSQTKEKIDFTTFEQLNFLSSDDNYNSYVLELVQNIMGLKTVTKTSPTRRILDIGSGTGTFLIQLLQHIPSIDAILIDPHITEKILAPALVLNTHMHFLRERAESFINIQHPDYAWRDRKWWQRGYHQVLLKEVIHYFHPSDRVYIFRGILEGLAWNITYGNTSPNIVILSRLKHDIEFPLWPEARELWEKIHPSEHEIQKDLKSAGFHNVKCTTHKYKCQLKWEKWVTFIKGKCWNVFSQFTEEQIDQGCQFMIDKGDVVIDKDGLIEFEDILVVITGDRVGSN